MYSLQENVSLKPFNTFNIEARARYFCEVNSEQALLELCQRLGDFKKYMVLGGGSNVLFCDDYDGLIILNKIKGQTFKNDADSVIAAFGGGENWHKSVLNSIEQGLYGLENLSLIPGTVGAAPVQNIGAYGVELKDIFLSLKAINLKTAELETFDLTQCEFGYRDSVFKNAAAGKYCITQVNLSLSKQSPLKTGYGEIEAEIIERGLGIDDLTPKIMSDVISTIRRRKLPDPSVLPNAGSFFKNPIISANDHEYLKHKFPGLVSYALPNGDYKLACGWLIDKLGWKGKSIDGARVHEKQALVLINEGGGAAAICRLAEQIQRAVHQEYGVKIEPEPSWIR